MSNIKKRFISGITLISVEERESLRAQVASLKEELGLQKACNEDMVVTYHNLTQQLAAAKEHNALLTKEKPNELISALKQAYLVIYKLYEHYDSSETAYGFAETLATIDKALANYATHSGVAVQEPVASQAEQVCAEAYQVVGSLLHDAGLFDSERATKILDNLSQARLVHTDVLPWAASPTLDKE